MDKSCYRHADRSTGVVCQRCDRPICPTCMFSASVGFHCPECVNKGSSYDEPISRAPTPIKTRSPNPISFLNMPATYIIIAANSVIFIFSVIEWGSIFPSTSGRIEINLGLIDRARHGGTFVGVAEGEWWRIFTSGFVHSGIIHFLINMALLWFVGRELELYLKTTRFFLLYTSCIIGSSFLVLALRPDNLTIGASGGVFGIMAAYVMLAKFLTGRFFGTTISLVLALNLGINAFLLFNPNSNISVLGHLGGLMTGLLIGASYTFLFVYMKERVPKNINLFVNYAIPIVVGGLLFLGSILIT